MNITLKLFASRGALLPPGSARDAIQLDVKDGATVGEVLANQQLPRANCHLILVNGIFAPPATADGKRLLEDDTLTVWPPGAGRQEMGAPPGSIEKIMALELAEFHRSLKTLSPGLPLEDGQRHAVISADRAHVHITYEPLGRVIPGGLLSLPRPAAP